MIRPYQSTDKEDLIKVFKLNVPKYFDPKETKMFEGYLERKGDTYFTMEIDDKIIGGAGCYVREGDYSGRITWIFFDPNYAGRGYGREIVEYCFSLLRKDKRVKSFGVRTSQLAFEFFEKMGYHTTLIEKNYWGEGLDLYDMEKEE